MLEIISEGLRGKVGQTFFLLFFDGRTIFIVFLSKIGNIRLLVLGEPTLILTPRRAFITNINASSEKILSSHNWSAFIIVQDMKIYLIKQTC